MTAHPLLASIPPDRLGDLLDTTPVGPGLITVTAIPADQWGEREVIAWRPDGDTALVVVETALMNPDDVPHRVAEFTEALRQVLDRMTPDQPTPVELTEQQLDALSAAGNRALNDHYHEDLCYCRNWPTSCASSDNYFMGMWDTSAFDIGLPAALGVWEALRNDRVADLAQVTRSYRLEHRHLEEATWRPNTPGIGACWTWQSREKADQRLAEARDRWPGFEHRLIEITTTVTESPVTPKEN